MARLGNPRTDAERKKRHKKLHGNTKLPKRGTGLKKNKLKQYLSGWDT